MSEANANQNGAGGTPAAASPVVNGTPPPAAAASTDWTTGLTDDLKSFVQTKGFKDPKDIVDSYRNFEKLQGAPKERLMVLPEKLEGDEMNAVWDRLGAPKEAKEYALEIPKEHGDEKLSEWAKEAFHKLKVPRNMAEGFVKEFNARQAQMLKEHADAMKAEVTNQHESLKKEWGAAFEQNNNIANQAALKFGMTSDQIKALGAALGPAAAAKFLHKLGQGIGEAGFVEGNGSNNGALTPEQARTQIKDLLKDTDFQNRLQSGDVAAKERWNRTHKFAYPGDMTI